MTEDNKSNQDKAEHRDPMERHTRPGLWGPASWWRAGILILAVLLAVLLLSRMF